MPGPLDGVRVLDFTRVLAGPYSTALMADLGADVIKVEAAHGDDYRHIGPFDQGESLLFQAMNRGKRSIVLDLKSAEGLAQVKALLKELRKMGKTILISSHILTELADCCTSIGIIERGQLLMHGPISDVYRRIRGNRIIDVKFTDNMDLGLTILRSSPHLRDIQVEDRSAVVELETDDNGVAELLHKLVNDGVGLRCFGEKDPTLEDVFMLVTQGLVS